MVHDTVPLQGKLTRQVAQTPVDLGCTPIAPYDITHGFMVSIRSCTAGESMTVTC